MSSPVEERGELKMKNIPRIPQQSSILLPISIKYLIATVTKFTAAAEVYIKLTFMRRLSAGQKRVYEFIMGGYSFSLYSCWLYISIMICYKRHFSNLSNTANFLNSIGYDAKVSNSAVLESRDLPALAEMITGHVVLVNRIDADQCHVYDPTQPLFYEEVSREQFQEFFGGKIIGKGALQVVRVNPLCFIILRYLKNVKQVLLSKYVNIFSNGAIGRAILHALPHRKDGFWVARNVIKIMAKPKADSEKLLERLCYYKNHGLKELEAWSRALSECFTNDCPIMHGDLDDIELPAIVEINNGNTILITSIKQGAAVAISYNNSRWRSPLPLDELGRIMSGRIISILKPDTEKGHDHWLISKILSEKRYIIEICIASFMLNFLTLSGALFSMNVYDRVIPNESEITLWVLTIGIFVAILFESTLRIFRFMIVERIGKRLDIYYHDILMERIVGSSVGDRRLGPGFIHSSINDFSRIRESLTSSTLIALLDLPFVVVSLFLLYEIGGDIILVLLLTVPVMLLPALILRRKMMDNSQKLLTASLCTSMTVFEAAVGKETIRTERAESFFHEKFKNSMIAEANIRKRQGWMSTALSHWPQTAQQLCYIVIVLIGAFKVFGGEYTVGTMIALSILSGRILGPLFQMSSAFSRLSNTKAALENAEKVLALPQRVVVGKKYIRRAKLGADLALHGIQVGFVKGGPIVLSVPEFNIKSGDHLVILGHNGSGKSTLLKVIAGLIKPQRGSINIDGISHVKIHENDFRRDVGYLPQQVKLMFGSLRENLTMSGLICDDTRLMDALYFAGLGSFVARHPRGLDMVLGERGEGLSIGQAQGVGLARLWLQNPQIVLMDEPTSALDQGSEREVVGRLGMWLRDKLVITVTHRRAVITIATHVAVMQDGNLVSLGSVNDLGSVAV